MRSAIIAYGKPEDRLRLAAISKHTGRSGSELLIDFIRARYEQLFGDLPPQATDAR